MTRIPLPKKARDRLIQAGNIANYEERRRAVDRAIDRAKYDHPECFIKDEVVPIKQETERC